MSPKGGKGKDARSKPWYWLQSVATSYTILSMDASACICWAKLMHRKSNTLYEDAMIATVAQVNSLTVVTRNAADFKALGVEVINPFMPGSATTWQDC